MRARDYAPAFGRFQSTDRYEQASADLSLVSDPLTQDRYAFAGGNPVNLVEWDGHEPPSSFRNGCDNTYGSSYAKAELSLAWMQLTGKNGSSKS